MATPRTIRSVLENFLGTYTSRYSEYDGYWLFGFLVTYLGEVRIDLQTPTASEPGSPLEVAVRTAATKFEDQVLKAGLKRSQVRKAWLTIQRLPGSVEASVNGHPCAGYNVSFLAEAVMDGGRHYEREKTVVVVPHNSTIEFRSEQAGSQ